MKIKKHKKAQKSVSKKIALSSNDDKILHSIDSIETYAHWMSKDLVNEKEYIKCNNIMKRYKMIDHLYMILIIGGSGTGKTKLFFNLNSATRYW